MFSNNRISFDSYLNSATPEILTTGKVNVDRRGIDAEELLEIRLGNVAYEVVLAEAEKLFNQLDNSYEISLLPYKVDLEKINQLAIELVQEFL